MDLEAHYYDEKHYGWQGVLEEGPTWAFIRGVVMSLTFQNQLATLAILHSMTTSSTLLLELFVARKHSKGLSRALLEVLEIFNIIVVFLFIVETLVRAMIVKDGFFNFLNQVDMVFLVFSSVLEAMNLVTPAPMSELVPLITTVRLMTSLQIIQSIHSDEIEIETQFNKSLNEDIYQLMYDLDLKETANIHLAKKLEKEIKNAAKTEHEIEILKIKVRQAQIKSWGKQAPPAMGLGMPYHRD
ncbi:hypothetical protein DSO57_1007981 [Entomophthora muscae]|uniref:Uncharacterized protein n=1 Tax=Entomophthora muscae TaxID=34485 RepID=A0ACC2TIT6_9FUNG|nr:hypothetical protein DSO57_1007981 [Entomophthora muscae]